MNAVLRRMKDETADLHALAEQYVRVLDHDADLDDYRRYLRAMHGYHEPLEAELVRLDPVGFDAASRRRAPLAARDLRTLGDEGPWPSCTVLPDTSTLPHLVGIAYVLEGSTLGGRYILSRLPPALARVRHDATGFLEGYGAETGARWRAFAGVVERALDGPRDEDAAVGAARDTFARLVGWLAVHEVRDEGRVSRAS